MYPDLQSERFRILLEVNISGHYHATLVFSEPGNRARVSILMETNLAELLTPDMAYMNLLNVSARKIRERDVLRQVVGLGSVHAGSSDFTSVDRE